MAELVRHVAHARHVRELPHVAHEASGTVTSARASALAPTRSSTRRTAHMTDEVDSGANDRDAAHVALYIVLCLNTSILRIATLGGGSATFDSEADVLVVPDVIFGQTVKDRVLASA